MARIELWNGDICDLEVDAIVNAANLSLWMSTGVGGALKRAGGDAIEFAAVRQAPVPLGEAIVTPAGKLAAKVVIHAVSLDRDRRTSGPVIEAAVRSAMARGSFKDDMTCTKAISNVVLARWAARCADRENSSHGG